MSLTKYANHFTLLYLLFWPTTERRRRENGGPRRREGRRRRRRARGTAGDPDETPEDVNVAPPSSSFFPFPFPSPPSPVRCFESLLSIWQPFELGQAVLVCAYLFPAAFRLWRWEFGSQEKSGLRCAYRPLCVTRIGEKCGRGDKPLTLSGR